MMSSHVIVANVWFIHYQACKLLKSFCFVDTNGRARDRKRKMQMNELLIVQDIHTRVLFKESQSMVRRWHWFYGEWWPSGESMGSPVAVIYLAKSWIVCVLVGPHPLRANVLLLAHIFKSHVRWDFSCSIFSLSLALSHCYYLAVWLTIAECWLVGDTHTHSHT